MLGDHHVGKARHRAFCGKHVHGIVEPHRYGHADAHRENRIGNEKHEDDGRDLAEHKENAAEKKQGHSGNHMQPDDRIAFEGHVRGKIAGKQAENRAPHEKKGRDEPDGKARSAQAFQEKLQERGFDHRRQSQAPQKFDAGDAEHVLFEVFVDHVFHFILRPNHHKVRK